MATEAANDFNTFVFVLEFMIAGHTAEYVNMQLQKAAERFGSTSRTPA